MQVLVRCGLWAGELRGSVRHSAFMQKPNDIDETASRADDEKTPAGRRHGNRGGNIDDGKNADVPQGGKRRGPGRWVDPNASGD